MGDLLKFKGQKPAKTGEKTENIGVVVCGLCENVGFLLAVDGRIFCSDCTSPVAASWIEDKDDSAA
jgi:hypothetical protein